MRRPFGALGGENPLSSMSPNARRARRLAPFALALAVGIVVAVLLGGGSSREYRLVFDNASQIVKGGAVRIGGVQVGTVQSIDLTHDDLAQVRISIDDAYGPLRDGSTATIRVSGLGSVAGRYVDVSPAPDNRRALADGAVIPIDKTTSTVDIDALLNALDGKTRKGLQRMVGGFADWYAGREQNANESARMLPAALGGLRRLSQEITGESAQFQQFLVQSGRATSALAREPERLTSLVGGARRTMEALASETAGLNGVLRDLPTALREGSAGLAELRATIPDLRGLLRSADLSSGELPDFLRQLRPVTERAVPVVTRLRDLVDRPGPGNDGLDALRDLPPLADKAHAALPRSSRALKDSTPIFSFIRPYIPDLVGWFRGYGAAAATYDARGHYVRSLPLFDAFRAVDGAGGTMLEPKALADRGKSDAVTNGNLRRCPGTAAASPDGSAPFVDDGPLANPDCAPAQRIGGGG